MIEYLDLDDLFEVPFHRLGLSPQLAAVSMSEPRSGPRLELVAREVLGC